MWYLKDGTLTRCPRITLVEDTHSGLFYLRLLYSVFTLEILFRVANFSRELGDYVDLMLLVTCNMIYYFSKHLAKFCHLGFLSLCSFSISDWYLPRVLIWDLWGLGRDSYIRFGGNNRKLSFQNICCARHTDSKMYQAVETDITGTILFINYVHILMLIVADGFA